MKKTLFSLFLICLVGQANAQGSRTKVILVGDAKIACQFNNTITSCLKVKNHPDSGWKEFPYKIEGFIYEYGMESQLEIEETPIAEPDSSGQKYTYKLLRVISSYSTVLKEKKLLANNKWKIVNIELDGKMTSAKKAGAYMVFDLDSNRISGFGGCNQFSGNTLIENGVLQFGLISNTVLSCLNDELEKSVMDGLKGKAAFYIRNNMLFIVCENRMNIHLRPEKRIDSLIREINKPVVQSRGNTYGDMKNGQFVITLDNLVEAGGKEIIMNSETLKLEEKKTLKFRLKNSTPEGPIAEIHILNKPHKYKGHVYATVIFRDGSKRSVELRNVL